VSALGAAQSVAIISQIGGTGNAVGGSVFGAGPIAHVLLGLLSAIFLAVAITVTSVVVTGSAEVVLTGQVRDIALRRLLGSPASAEQSRATRTIMRRAVTGMAWGTVAGYAVSLAVLSIRLSASGQLHVTAGTLVPSPFVIISLAAQLMATWGAVRRGVRAVTRVQPIEALRRSADPDTAVGATLAVASGPATAALWGGVSLLALAVVMSARSPFAVLPAVTGGVLSFIGLVSNGERFVPRLLGGVSRALPRTFCVSLARRSLLRHPARTTRAVLAVSATITLVATFSIGIASFEQAVREHYDGSAVQGAATDVLSAVVSVVLVLTGFLALTAAIALGNAVSFSIRLRRRDIALLRILGQSQRDSRAGILAQSLLLSLTAAVLGLALGTIYGWIGAQSVFGVRAPGHVVAPILPWPLLAGTAAATGLLTLAASLVPIRASLRQPPIRAFLKP
jgi:putative ABC transport system permease protein